MCCALGIFCTEEPPLGERRLKRGFIGYLRRKTPMIEKARIVLLQKACVPPCAQGKSQIAASRGFPSGRGPSVYKILCGSVRLLYGADLRSYARSILFPVYVFLGKA